MKGAYTLNNEIFECEFLNNEFPNMEIWGIIPHFFSHHDERTTIQQINENYQSGWLPTKGGTLDLETMAYTYPGDPPMLPRSVIHFRGDRIYLYPYSFVCVVHPDNTWQMARLD